MKKKIFLIILVVCLVLGGIGGAIYANVVHTPMTGNKLVGTFFMGTMGNDELGSYANRSHFVITNPDCENIITINEMSVLAEDGTVIYQGPLVSRPIQNPDGSYYREVVTELLPHQTELSWVHNLMWRSDAPYPDEPERMENWDWNSLSRPGEHYSIEISYTTDGIQLLGWQREWTLVTEYKNGKTEAYSRDHMIESPVVNVVQD